MKVEIIKESPVLALKTVKDNSSFIIYLGRGRVNKYIQLIS
jgi:hypothetical protein